MPGPNIRVVEDRARVEGGHAIIQVAGVAQYQGDGTIGIRRLGYEAAHLSSEGWRIAEARVTADSYDVRNGVASFYVGPEVTRHLTPDDQVALDINGIAGQAVLIWPAITPFYEGKTEFRRFSTRRAAPPPPPPEEDVTVMTPRPVPPPEPVVPEPVTPEPLVATREDVAPDKVKDKPARRTGLIGVLAATVWCVACFALGAVIYDVLVAETPVVATAEPTPPALPEPAPETPPETPPSLPEPEPAPAQSPTPAPEPAPAPGPRSVRDIVRDAANPQELFDEAMKFRAQGDHQGMLLLLENAAERGHARAMFEIARLYDPASFVEGQPFSRPNPGQAAKFYRKAEAAGVAEAGPALVALKTRLEAAAAAGDLDAKAALSTYWPGTTP